MTPYLTFDGGTLSASLDRVTPSSGFTVRIEEASPYRSGDATSAVLMFDRSQDATARLVAAAINGDLDKAIESAFHDGFAAGMDADDRPCAEQASEAWADETPEPCTEEAFARGCFCYVPAPGPTDIDPPEPKRHPECPLHGWRDPDRERDDAEDRRMMEGDA